MTKLKKQGLNSIRNMLKSLQDKEAPIDKDWKSDITKDPYKYDPEIMSALQQGIIDFFMQGNKACIDPRRPLDHFLSWCAHLGGRCPCDSSRNKCPCKQAVHEIQDQGHCICGLFYREDLYQDRKDGKI